MEDNLMFLPSQHQMKLDSLRYNSYNNSIQKETGDTTDELSSTDSVENEENVEQFINEKFCNLVVDRIKAEVKEDLVNAHLLNSVFAENLTGNAVQDSRLVESLQNQILFLRQELLSRNQIIELMIRESLENNSGTYHVTPHDEQPILLQKHRTQRTNGNCFIELAKYSKVNGTTSEVNNFASYPSLDILPTEKSKKENKQKSDVKCLHSQQLFNSLRKEQTFVKSVSGLMTPYVSDFTAPDVSQALPDMMMMRQEASDLRNERVAKQVAMNIVSLAEKVKNGENEIVILGIVPHGSSGKETGKSAVPTSGPLDTSRKCDTEFPSVGKLIQKGRLDKGMSQKDLATKINEKVHIVSDYESGRTIPNNQIMSKIEKALGIKLRGEDKGKHFNGMKQSKK